MGDETAVPAVCAVLEQLPATARGTAFLEVPVAADVQDVRASGGRRGACGWPARATRSALGLHDAVVAHLGIPGAQSTSLPTRSTPTCGRRRLLLLRRGRRGRDVTGSAAGDLYAWIAGESTVVTGLRRHLVKELGFDRSQVAFMGYWRRGVAMKS